MVVAENNNGDGDLYRMDFNLQTAEVDGEVGADQYQVGTEESFSVVEKNQIQSRTGGISTFGVSDYDLIDLIVQCTRYNESLAECVDRLDEDAKRWELQLANAQMSLQRSFFREQTDAITDEIYNMISSAHAEMYGLVERMSTNVSSVRWDIGSIKTLTDQFKIETDSNTPRSTEGLWTRLIKSGFGTVSSIKDDSRSIKAFTDGWSIYDHNSNYVKEGYDGTIIKYFKNGLGYPLDRISSNTYDLKTNFDRQFSQDPKWNGDLNTREMDGPFIRLLKNGMSYPKELKQLYEDDWKVGNFDTKYNSFNDGHIVGFFKAMWTDIVSIKNSATEIKDNTAKQGGGGGGASASDIFKAFEDSLEDFQSSFDKMVKYLKNFEVTNEAGTNFWDVIGKIVDGLTSGFGDMTDLLGDLLDFIENMMDFFVEVFVPKKNVIEEGFESLNELMAAKFKSMNLLKNTINSTFNQPQKEFKDISVSLPGFGHVDILKSGYINSALPITRELIGGAMILMTSIWAYRKITTELIQ